MSLSVEKQQQKFWIDNFKDKVFCQCLWKGYEEDSQTIFNLMSKRDLFAQSDDVNLHRDTLVKTLGSRVVANCLHQIFILKLR